MTLRSIAQNGYPRIYATLALLRAVFAFVGTGYIHPDEYFQNGEITAGGCFHLRLGSYLHILVE